MDIISTLGSYLLTTANLAIWLISILINSYFIFSMWKFVDTTFEKEVAYLTIFTLIIYAIGQWVDIISVLGHKGFYHGFTLHLAKEGGGWAYSFYGIANMTFAFIIIHILKKYKK